MKKLKNGFTLIEILVVIIIAGIMISIAIPAYKDYNNRNETIILKCSSVMFVLVLFLGEGSR